MKLINKIFLRLFYFGFFKFLIKKCIQFVHIRTQKIIYMYKYKVDLKVSISCFFWEMFLIVSRLEVRKNFELVPYILVDIQ